MVKMTEEDPDFEGKWPDPRERAAPARREEMAAFAAELKADPAKALKFFQGAGILNARGELTPQYGGPVAWVRNLTDPQPHCVTGLQYRTAADADAGVQYIPVYTHPTTAAEVQAEPVAWMAFGGHLIHDQIKRTTTPVNAALHNIPLYAHPDAQVLLDSYADENQRISDERDALKLRLAVLEAGAEAPTCPVCGSDCNERDDYEGKWPEGDVMTEWVMVPREPGDEMLDAAQRESDLYRLDLVRAYRAMLDAAPAAPQQAEPVAHVTVEHFRNNPAMRNVDCDLIADLPPGTHALYLHPPAAEVQRLREAAYNAIEAFDQGAHGADEIDALRRALKGGE